MNDTHALTASDAEAESITDHKKTPTPLIVAIGASAGGLEAIEQFLEHVPALSGMAYVVIQHMDPSHQKSMMVELLTRVTPMSVVIAENDMQVEADHVYVIPPSKDMSILHGRIQLLEQVPIHGMRMPVDYFFRALADDQQENAIGVVLSGMGTDGTLGLRAIKERGGLALVQEPDTARFDSMPRTAITTVVVDIVAPPDELPKQLINYLQTTTRIPKGDRMLEVKSQSALEKIVVLLREHTGHDMSMYKKSSMYRRIERRMGLHQIDNIANYVRYLRETPQELELLFKELLIGVTSFFRDRHVWEVLKQEVFPDLLSRHPPGKHFRAWVPACSSGEEAFSLAMAFREAVEEYAPNDHYSLQIFATDLDEDAIDRARRGFYPANIAADVSPEQLERFFIPEGNGYRVNKHIREKVIFAPQNLIMDPPFTKLDLISCRNLMIYLGQDLQQKLFPLFHYVLNPNGLLLVGTAETVSAPELFSPVDHKARLYQKIISSLDKQLAPRYFPVIHVAADDRKTAAAEGNLQVLADQLLLQNFAPPAVLINSDGDILYVSGRTGRFLEPAAGKANWNIYAMAKEELRHELTMTVKRALRQTDIVKSMAIKLLVEGVQTCVSIVAQQIEKPAALQGTIIVVFTQGESLGESAQPDGQNPNQRSLLEELRHAHEELLSTREEIQTSQEEFKATYEELHTINGELQTANEELSTSREEMQSVNEELHTVNQELQAKMDDLAAANNDLVNLISGTDIIAVFLDNALHVRRFTPASTQLFKLIPSDIGRPLTDVVTTLRYPDLAHDAMTVLRSLINIDKRIEADGNRHYHVRILPYRTLENIVDGVLITFTDVSSDM
jgi:chemotaxis protein methyltransferase CheR/two-component system CheB/CheR fusion protein